MNNKKTITERILDESLTSYLVNTGIFMGVSWIMAPIVNKLKEYIFSCKRLEGSNRTKCTIRALKNTDLMIRSKIVECEYTKNPSDCKKKLINQRRTIDKKIRELKKNMRK